MSSTNTLKRRHGNTSHGNAARRPRLRLVRHRSTTANVASLYPPAVQAPLPCAGPLLGRDVTAGGAGLCWDPFEAYTAGLVTNPNVFVLGEPGFAKSSITISVRGAPNFARA